MKAIQISRFGGPEVLQLAEVPVPALGPGQVLIRVAAAGINFAETLMREDAYVASYALPAIPGSELSGTIEALGEGVTGFAVGQRIGAVLAAARTLTGGYAEYAVADARVLAAIPDALDFAAATALLVQGLTALYLTREVSPAGRDVMITAAGGGVGSLLIQLARNAGARRIVAVASNSAKRDHALSLGADAAISYEEITSEGPSLIFESAGGEVLPSCLDALAPRGTLVAYGSLNLQSFALDVPGLKKLVFGNQSLRGFAFGPLVDLDRVSNDVQHLFALAVAGELTPAIGAIYPLDQVAQAHRDLADRQTVGKLILRTSSDAHGN